MVASSTLPLYRVSSERTDASAAKAYLIAIPPLWDRPWTFGEVRLGQNGFTLAPVAKTRPKTKNLLFGIFLSRDVEI